MCDFKKAKRIAKYPNIPNISIKLINMNKCIPCRTVDATLAGVFTGIMANDGIWIVCTYWQLMMMVSKAVWETLQCSLHWYMSSFNLKDFFFYKSLFSVILLSHILHLDTHIRVGGGDAEFWLTAASFDSSSRPGRQLQGERKEIQCWGILDPHRLAAAPG